uniref:Cap n=1 Tax=Porcine circovirus 4 TaxID=2686039 RepID=A0A8A3UZM7_9CIRC|nr:Cap [Porcine circovirus 4]
MPIRSRYSRRRRNRWSQRRRGLWPRASRRRYRWRRKNGIFHARFMREVTLSVSSFSTPSWNVGHYDFKLKDFIPKGPGTIVNLYSLPLAYYRIRKVKVEFLPLNGINSNRTYSSTAIQLDGDYVGEGKNQTYDVLANHSSRHGFTNIARHSRYFTPKPQDPSGETHTLHFQPNNKRNQWWISMADQDLVHHGLQYSIQNSNFVQVWTVRFTLYVQFREFDLVNYPKQG